MRYTEARAILSEAIEQLDELTDAEMAKLEKEHEARMAEQERTAYMSPKMRYHVDLLRKLRLAKKPRRKKVNEEEQLDEATLERNKKRAAAEGGVGGILHKFKGFLGSSKSK